MTQTQEQRHPPAPELSTRAVRRRRGVWVAVVLVAAVLAGIVVWRVARPGGGAVSGDVVVTASSTARGFSARDVVSSGSAERPGASWRSGRQGVGAWVQLDWPAAHPMNQLVIVRNPLTEGGVTAGFVSFGDGSQLQVELAPDARVTTVDFTPRTTDRLRFTATEVGPGATSVTIAELVVSEVSGAAHTIPAAPADGNVGRTATPSSGLGSTSATALVDGSGVAGATGIGTGWTVPAGDEAWAELRWARPVEVDAVELIGTTLAGSTTPGSAVVELGDGAALPVGAVLADPSRPTLVGFMPHVVTSLRVSLKGSAGSTLALGELRVYARGYTPVRLPGTGRPPPGVTVPDPAACPADPASTTTPPTSMVLVCPLSGSAVGDRTRLTLVLPVGSDAVTARVLGAGGSRQTTTRGSDGTARLELDTSAVPPGPFTVELDPDRGDAVFVQLLRIGATPADVGSSAAAAGRTLAYAEEFSTPVSLSRTGRDADYAAAKPVDDGSQDFGDAIFPDPRDGDGNVGVIGGGLLHLGVQPLPDGATDPQGYGRTHLGGLVASARAGGSGFSAQYGYFEARMFVPASTGTWPAFWLLPSDNLVAPTPVVAEVDAVELYGHDPRGACHSTHEYLDGKDGGVARCGRRFDAATEAVGWHTYGVSVTPTENVFFVDGAEVARAPQVKGGGSPMFFLADLALGGGWPVDLDATRGRADLYVDYVRVYV